MKNLVVLLIFLGAGWFGYQRFKEHRPSQPSPEPAAENYAEASPADPTEQFTCDGRTHCSHMRSCAEATYFIQHCPGTKMDGDNDGIPCEKQWCN